MAGQPHRRSKHRHRICRHTRTTETCSCCCSGGPASASAAAGRCQRGRRQDCWSYAAPPPSRPRAHVPELQAPRRRCRRAATAARTWCARWEGALLRSCSSVGAPGGMGKIASSSQAPQSAIQLLLSGDEGVSLALPTTYWHLRTCTAVGGAECWLARAAQVQQSRAGRGAATVSMGGSVGESPPRRPSGLGGPRIAA